MTAPAVDPREGVGRKLLRALLGLVILGVAYMGVFSILASLATYPVTGRPVTARALRGAYHVHTRASDGRGDLADVVRAARRAGLRFVIVTDHNREPADARYVDGVLVITATEWSTRHGHLVVLGADAGLSIAERDTRPVEAAKARGGLAVLAHPVQPRNPWLDWASATRADGLELFSADTILREAQLSPHRLVCAAGAYLARPEHGLMVLVTPQREAEARLLEIEGSAHAPLALCSHDAHGYPPYERVFGVLATYLAADQLEADPEGAARQILSALSEGRTFCAFDALGSPEGFAIEFPDAGVRTGDRMAVRLPPLGSSQARIHARGAVEFDSDAGLLHARRPGVAFVQVELWAPDCTGHTWRPWIVAAPFRVAAP